MYLLLVDTVVHVHVVSSTYLRYSKADTHFMLHNKSKVNMYLSVFHFLCVGKPQKIPTKIVTVKASSEIRTLVCKCIRIRIDLCCVMCSTYKNTR